MSDQLSDKLNDRHWASVQEAGALSGMKFMFSVYRLCGRLPFRLILAVVILYFFLFRGTARAASQEYLRNMRAAGRLTCKPGLLTSYRHFLTFGESLLDKLAVWQGDIRLEHITFHQYHLIEQCTEAGKGAVLIGSHLGNIEICRALAQLNQRVRINVLMHTAHAPKFNQLLQQAGSKSQVNIIQVTEITPATAIELQEKVDAGEFIVIAGDRTPLTGLKNTAEVTFLGHQARLPHGPYLIAALLKCPVMTIFCLRRPGRQPRFDLYVDPFAERIRLQRNNREASLDACAQQYASTLEDYCEKSPLQWYNFHSFWTAPDFKTDI